MTEVGVSRTAQSRSAGMSGTWHGSSRPSEPVREAVPKTESSWREPFLVGCTNRVRVRGASCVSIGCEWREQRVEDIGRKGHEGGQSGIAWREGQLEA